MREMNKLDLMGYLYGELSEEERQEVEQWLENNPEAQQELEELQETRSWMTQLPEVKPIAPLHPMPVAQPTPARSRWLPWASVAAAAAILLLLMVANTSITVSEQGMTIAFGQPMPVETPAIQPSPILDEEWKEQVAQSLKVNNEIFQQRLDSIQRELQQQLAQNQQVLMNQWQEQITAQDEVQRQKLEQFATNYYQKAIPGIAANLQNMQLQQQQELQLMLDELWNDWLAVRRADLQVIQVNMQNLQQNVELNKTQTRDFLENMLVRVNN